MSTMTLYFVSKLSLRKAMLTSKFRRWEKVGRNMGAWRQENEELKRKASKLEPEKSKKKSKAARDDYYWS